MKRLRGGQTERKSEGVENEKLERRENGQRRWRAEWKKVREREKERVKGDKERKKELRKTERGRNN